MDIIKNNIAKLFKKFGYNIYHVNKSKELRKIMFLSDIKRLLKEKDHPIIFDIGGNLGQTIQKFRNTFPRCTVYSFEPSPTTFAQLSDNFKNIKNVYLENLAVGSTNTTMEFLENEDPSMSSFLELDKSGWGSIIRKTIVDTTTIDEYCKQKNIDRIDVVKSDTQGFEYEVFKGAADMMKSNKIHMLFF